MLSVLALVLVNYFGSKIECGIPLFRWILIYIILLSCKSLTNLLKIPLIRRQSSYLGSYTLISFLLVDGSYLAWLIYGNVLYYSKENNCGKLDVSKNMNEAMFVLLIIGYF
jgi:hypothetical protein